ncbi:ApeA N-terminal domain 1-containing protein [Streptomyces shaanxiensis]
MSVTEPVVYGTTRQDKEVTLFEVRGDYLPGMPSSEETYRPGLILIGDHAASEAFTEVQVEIEYLHDWASVPDMVSKRRFVSSSS